MMFADDAVICSESREQVEEKLQRWRSELERRGMKVSGTVRSQGGEVEKVHEMKSSGSAVQGDEEFGKEVKRRVEQVEQVENSDTGAELMMLRFSLGETRTDRMKKEQVRCLETQSETRWRYLEHVTLWRCYGDSEENSTLRDFKNPSF